MKKIAILFTCLLSCSISICQTGKDSLFTVKIRIDSIERSAKIYLLYQAEGVRTRDSAEQENGWYVFKGKSLNPLRATLVADHKYIGLATLIKNNDRNLDHLYIYLHPGTIIAESHYLLSKAVFKGSVINMDDAKLMAMLKNIMDQQRLLSDSMMATKDSSLANRLYKQMDSLGQAMRPIYKKFVLENPDSYVALPALQTYAGAIPDYNEIEPMFDRLSASVKETALGKSFHKKLLDGKSLVAGSTAPGFTQNDTANIPVSLSSFKGRYVLIDFWASWCGPCRLANPELTRIHQDFKNRNFTILGVSLDEVSGRDQWIKAIHDDRLIWTQVSDLKHWENAVAKLYSIPYVPYSFLIDPKGTIVARGLTNEELRKKLEQILPVQ